MNKSASGKPGAILDFTPRARERTDDPADDDAHERLDAGEGHDRSRPSSIESDIDGASDGGQGRSARGVEALETGARPRDEDPDDDL